MKIIITVIIFILVENTKQDFFSFQWAKDLFGKSESNPASSPPSKNFVTIWTPKFAKQSAPINVYYTAKGLDEVNTVSVTFKFRNLGITKTLNEDGAFDEINFRETSNLVNKLLTLNVILSQKNNNGAEMCMQKSISNIASDKNPYHTFIQLDKPVYKPGDKIRLRVIILDNDLKLYHVNNINVKLIDPLGTKTNITNDLSNRERSVIEETINLADELVLGSWMIEVAVDGGIPTTKIFGVQKYVLPPFEVVIETSEKDYLKSSDVNISFYGRYSFEEYVMNGDASLTITKKSNLKEVFRNVYKVNNVTTLTWKEKNFPANAQHEEYEIFVSLVEPVSGYATNSTATFKIHDEQSYYIVPVHTKEFQPGMPFHIGITVYDWEGNLIPSHYDKPIITIVFANNQGAHSTETHRLMISGNKTICEVKTKENMVEMTIEAQFVNSKIYRATVKKGAPKISVSELVVSHFPKIPKLYETVEISVKKDQNIDKLFVIYTTQKGNIMKEIQTCTKENEICRFTTNVDENKIPSFTVSVHHIVNEKLILTGSTVIATSNLGTNELTIEVPTTVVKPYADTEVNFRSTEKSKVYVLAFDERLSFIAKGNDVTNDNVRESYENYEGENNFVTIDLNLNSNWHQCSEKELDMIKNGRKSTSQLSASSQTAFVIDLNFMDVDITPENRNKGSKVGEFRENFPETWIFWSFDVEAGEKKTIKKRAPDAITSYVISAFAVSKETAIAIAQPKKLTVKLNFFIKLFLPYSIRYKEILRVDILVYNYVRNSVELSVTVLLENLYKTHNLTGNRIKEFEFVKFTSNACTFSKEDERKTVLVKEGTVQKVSFYIRSNPEDDENSIKRNILLQARASTKNMEYKDAVRKRLLVEQVGIRMFQVNTISYKLNGESKTYEFKDNEAAEKFPKSTIIVSGDQLSANMNLDIEDSFYPTGCAEQRTSGFKGITELYRYRKMKNLNTSIVLSHLAVYYQRVTAQNVDERSYWSYIRNSSGYTAYYMDAFISATELGAFDLNKKFIENELEVLVRLQNSSGEFSQINLEKVFPDMKRTNSKNDNFFDTSYALIPILKYKNLLESRSDKLNSKLQSLLDKGFKYLKDSNNIENYGYAIGAYAYALNNDHTKAKSFLDNIKQSEIIFARNKICYKASSTDASCDFRHTVFVALAFIAVNQLDKAEPIIDYLLEHHFKNQYYSNTYDYAIASEAIAKFAGKTLVGNSNLRVTIKNDRSFEQILNISNEPSSKFNEISLPDYTKKVSITTTGQGYCTIISIFETRVNANRTSQLMDVTVNPNTSMNTVKICAQYSKSAHPSRKGVLTNVIYEIETPSGYVFDSVVDYSTHTKYLKKTEERNKKTLVILYFDRFNENTNYCVNIQLKKHFHVKNIKPAGVKVYDYEKKDYSTLMFYKMEENFC